MAPILAAITQLGTDLGGRLERFETKVEWLEVGLLQLRVDVMDRLDWQQNTLSAMQNNTRVSYAAVQVVRDREALMREEHDVLAKQVSLMHRQLMSLENRFDARENGA